MCFSVFVSSQQRFGVTDIKAPSACHSSHVSTDHVAAIRQISVMALFYLGDSRKIDLRVVRAHRSKDMKRRAPQRAGARERERERASEHTHAVGREGGGGERAHARTHARTHARCGGVGPFGGSSSSCMFFPPLGLPYANWA